MARQAKVVATGLKNWVKFSDLHGRGENRFLHVVLWSPQMNVTSTPGKKKANRSIVIQRWEETESRNQMQGLQDTTCIGQPIVLAALWCLWEQLMAFVHCVYSLFRLSPKLCKFCCGVSFWLSQRWVWKLFLTRRPQSSPSNPPTAVIYVLILCKPQTMTEVCAYIYIQAGARTQTLNPSIKNWDIFCPNKVRQMNHCDKEEFWPLNFFLKKCISILEVGGNAHATCEG